MIQRILHFFQQFPLLSSVVSGLLLGIAWPPVSWSPLILVAFVPLWTALKGQSRKKSVTMALITCLIWSTSVVYWIANLAVSIPSQMMVILGICLIGIATSLPLLIVVFIGSLRKQEWLWILIIIWPLWEFLIAQSEFGFAWMDVGLSASTAAIGSSIFFVVGKHGMSAAILLFNYGVLRWLTARSESRLKSILSFVLPLVLVVVWGTDQLIKPSEDGQQINVLALQPNINPYQKTSEHSLKERVQIISDLCYSHRGKKVDLIVGPEGYLKTAENNLIDLDSIDDHPSVKFLKNITTHMDAPIIIGFIGKRGVVHSEDFKKYTGALMITPDQPTQYTTKNKLVPFTERVPYVRNNSSQLKFSFNQSSSSYSCEPPKMFEYRGLRIAVPICIEALFPKYVEAIGAIRPNLIAVIANDGWCGNTSGPYQNLAYCAALAKTQQLPIVRSANTGISALIHSSGKTSQPSMWSETTSTLYSIRLESNN